LNQLVLPTLHRYKSAHRHISLDPVLQGAGSVTPFRRLPNLLQRLRVNTALALQIAERSGERCGGPVLLAGLVLGIGVVKLSSGALGQPSRFSLELLILLVLQLVGPMLVALLSMALLLPRWLASCEDRSNPWRPGVAAAALVGVLLLVLFLLAALTGGVLASPRSDLFAEFSDVLRGLSLSDLLRCCLRSAIFLSILCSWSQWRGGIQLHRGVPPALVSSNLQVEGLTLLLGLKLLWIIVLDPLLLSLSVQ
jgi:hypothetical protein